MATTDFFTDQSPQSRTKATIVSKYFDGWSNVVGPVAKKRGETIQYVDLFAGPGSYADGTESTPLLVLRMAIAKPKIHDLLVCRFNDADPETAGRLEQAVNALPGIELLRHRPVVSHTPVDEGVAELFEQARLPATLTFIDPYGYKGLSMRLIQAALKGWGCDCVFFFNFNRVNAAIDKDDVEEHISRLFDTADAKTLRLELRGMGPQEREARVMEVLVEAIKRKHGKHVLYYSFLNDAASRTSHHLVFATKHGLGCKIMKALMAKESTWTEGGLPSFGFSPKPQEKTLFDALDDPVAELEEMLLGTFAGQQLTVGQIYEQHGLNRRFMPPDYKQALKRLEAAGRVEATPPAAERTRETMADRVLIRFPARTA
jgi:three-Cys-motif partner protein